MRKDGEGQSSTWKSYDKSKSEMREGGKWEEGREECSIICLL
jgi:hypothetical protein